MFGISKISNFENQDFVFLFRNSKTTKFINFEIKISNFQPFFWAFGLITNFLSIKVIRNRRHVKHFKNPMYKHILFNAWFKVSLCIIYSLSLINICIFPKNSFCSSVLKYEKVNILKFMAFSLWARVLGYAVIFLIYSIR
jgi:hypothetical protein